MNELILKAKIVEKGMTINEFSKEIGMSAATYYRKTNNSTFTSEEINNMANVLKLNVDDIVNIFFNNLKVA